MWLGVRARSVCRRRRTTSTHGVTRSTGSSAAEWISSGSWRADNGLRWIGGGAVGLASGVGVPAYRVFVGVQTSMGGARDAKAAPMPVVQTQPTLEPSVEPSTPALATNTPSASSSCRASQLGGTPSALGERQALLQADRQIWPVGDDRIDAQREHACHAFWFVDGQTHTG